MRGPEAHSAGGRCAPHFSGFFCWRRSGRGTHWPVATEVGPETEVSTSRTRPRLLSRFPRLRKGAVLPRPREPRLPGGRLLPEPAGPCLTSAQPSAPKPRRVSGGLGCGRSPGRSRLPTLLRERGDPTPPCPGLTRPGSTKKPRDSRWRETEAGEAGTCLSHRAGQGRAASNPRPHLNCSAGLGRSHPPPPCRENSESSFPLQSPSPCPAHFCRRAKPLQTSPGRLLWAGSYSARKARPSFLATQLGPQSGQIATSGVIRFRFCCSQAVPRLCPRVGLCCVLV